MRMSENAALINAAKNSSDGFFHRIPGLFSVALIVARWSITVMLQAETRARTIPAIAKNLDGVKAIDLYRVAPHATIIPNSPIGYKIPIKNDFISLLFSAA